MSHASVKPAASSSTPSSVLADLAGFGVQLLLSSLERVRTAIEQAPSVPLQLPGLAALRPQDCCAIPETECPPRCVCDVTWQASPGEKPGLLVRVTNASTLQRVFQLHATPFVGPGGSPGTIALSPPTLTLQPGQAGIASAGFTVPTVPDGDYQAEIVVKGAYEQCVRVRLRVHCRKTCGDEQCTCEVVQGDPPVRITAHHWYHHFQCVEPCQEDGRVQHDH